MKEFRFLVCVIVLLELSLFACGLAVVSNRHQARELFIQLEREQQTENMLLDERSLLKLELAQLEQTAQIKAKAIKKGLKAADPSQVVVLPYSANMQKQPDVKK